MKKLPINGAELCYRDIGSGRPIILLHAFPLNQTMWDDQVEVLASGHRVITLDWPGFGQSPARPDRTGLEFWADDLAELMKSLAIDRAVICGLSMGGYAAFALYRRYPEIVSALVLANTRAMSDTEEGKRARYEMIELVRSQGVSSIAKAMIPRLIGETTMRKVPNVAQRVTAMIESGQPEGIAQALLAMANRPDSTGLLPAINCPALIVSGNEDKLIPPTEAEKMNQLLPGSSYELIQDAGHLTNLERPERFNSVLLNFLNRLSSEGR
jgi:pimeloyl-ACP methyl ester carboxylesterase